MAPEFRQLNVNGVQLLLQESGSGPGLLFLHGWTLDHRMWKHQTGPLGGYFRVIAVDRRGFGRSSGIPDLTREPEDIASVMELLGVGRAVLCAASQAGRIAMHFALAYPEKLRALVLQGPALDGMPEPASDPGYVPFAEYAQLIRSGAVEEFRKRWLNHPFLRLPEGRIDLHAEVEEMVCDCPCLDLRQAGVTSPGAAPDITGMLSRISAPTLIIAGTEETPHRKTIARTLLREIPGARFTEISGGGHLINMIDPEVYNQTLLEFLNNLP